MILLLIACHRGPALELRLTDESGAPSRGWAEIGDERWESDADGHIRLGNLDHPVLALVGGDGRLTEPVALGPEDADAPVEIRLWDDTRVAMHFGGDWMLGRRYLEPGEGETPLLPAEGRAEATRALLADLAPLMRLAELAVANSESVVADSTHTEPVLDAGLANTPDDDLPYPGKRWVLQTPPEVAEAAVDALDLDFLSMGNNHQYDWEEYGLASALAALGCEDPDLALEDPCVGAGLSAEESLLPGLRSAGGLRVGMVAMTSVNGDWVNDNYPTDPEDFPEDPDMAWVGQPVRWGAPGQGVAVSDRVIGEAWAEIAAIEGDLDEEDRAALWASARAAYPGLQDWVARRGHGGAASLEEGDTGPLEAQIAALRPEVDVLIVQLHMGFQFADLPGAAVREAARAAVEAGADLVICHHPHVLQGLEWHEGKLIAYSLGNLVFDQDFLSTFPSVVLRTIFDDSGQLLEARLLPLWLDAYRPVPTVGDRARASLAAMWESSLIAASTERGADGWVRAVPDGAPAAWPLLTWERGSARLSAADTLPTWAVSVEIPESGVAVLPPLGLALAGEGAPDVELGRALFRLGSFEDLDTDAEAGELSGWSVGGSADLSLTDRAAVGERALELVRHPGDSDRIYARTSARATLPQHRLWSDADGSAGLDGQARYSVRLWVWEEGEAGLGSVRLDLYHFDDLDPTVEPESELLRSIELPILAEGRGWQEVLIDLDPAIFEAEAAALPNAALLYVFLAPPEHSATVLRVDEVELIEWRPAGAGPTRPVRAELVRGAPGALALPLVRW